MEQKLPELERETTGLKLYPLITLMGWVLIGFSILISIIVLGPTASAYWGGSAKSIRDAAEIGTPLLAQLTVLAWWPKLLPPLTFLGVTFFMLGIALEFAAIPGILDRRTNILVKALPLMGKKS